MSQRLGLLSVIILFGLCQISTGDDLSVPECSGCVVTEEVTAAPESLPLCESCVAAPLPEESSVSRSDFPE